ncbi:MAG: citrate/2-methylcitrate synthase [Clostridia bacterium]|nr:citrate/2-methylcitrate synthase [Clostridia bacterium]
MNNKFLENNKIDNHLDNLINLAERMDVIPSELYNKYNVKRGLRNSDGTGVLVGLTSIGEVHGYTIEDSDKIPADGKLLYRGLELKQLVKGCLNDSRHGFEEICFLILFGVLPNKEQLSEFKDLLVELRTLPNNFIEDMILKAPSPNVMNKLARSVLALYSYDSNPDDVSVKNTLIQSIGLIAKFPVLIANAYSVKRHAYDDESLYIHNPNPDLDIAENFLYMIRPNREFTKEEADILDLCLMVHAEHGGGNNSAFTTHVVSSTGTDTYSAISAAIGALKGPKHGGASLSVTEMFEDIKEHVSDWKNESEVEEYLTKIAKREAFDRTGLIYGMGHAIYTLSDPRAVMLKSKARELAWLKGREDEFELYELVEKLSPVVFKKIKGDSKVLCANVDFYSGFIYSMLGITKDLYIPLFAMSRIVGWCAHRIEEIISGGKIMRPAYKSVTHKAEYTSLNDRN